MFSRSIILADDVIGIHLFIDQFTQLQYQNQFW